MADLVFLYPDTSEGELRRPHSKKRRKKKSERNKNMDWIQIIVTDKDGVGWWVVGGRRWGLLIDASAVGTPMRVRARASGSEVHGGQSSPTRPSSSSSPSDQ